MDAGLENAKVFWVLAEDLFVEKLPAGDMTYLVDDRSFKARIKQALEYLGDSSPEWLQYVTQREYWIGPCGPCPDGRSKASWSLDLSDRRVYIHEDTFESNMRLAQVLVHESCHIHQGYEDRWPPGVLDADTIVRLEKECNAKELEMTLDIDPDDPRVKIQEDKLMKPHRWWRVCATGGGPWPAGCDGEMNPPPYSSSAGLPA